MTPALLVLVAAASTLVFVEGSLFRPIRERGPRLWRELVSCPLCLGVWVGWAAALLDLGRLPETRPEWLLGFGMGPLAGVLAYFARMILDVLDAWDTRPDR